MMFQQTVPAKMKHVLKIIRKSQIMRVPTEATVGCRAFYSKSAGTSRFVVNAI